MVEPMKSISVFCLVHTLNHQYAMETFLEVSNLKCVVKDI